MMERNLLWLPVYFFQHCDYHFHHHHRYHHRTVGSIITIIIIIIDKTIVMFDFDTLFSTC